MWLPFVGEHRAEVLNRPFLEPSETNKYECYVNNRHTVKLNYRVMKGTEYFVSL